MVTQIDAFEVGGRLEGVPLSSRNRRRIWRILSEMRPPPMDQRNSAEELGLKSCGDDDDDDA